MKTFKPLNFLFLKTFVTFFSIWTTKNFEVIVIFWIRKYIFCFSKNEKFSVFSSRNLNFFWFFITDFNVFQNMINIWIICDMVWLSAFGNEKIYYMLSFHFSEPLNVFPISYQNFHFSSQLKPKNWLSISFYVLKCYNLVQWDWCRALMCHRCFPNLWENVIFRSIIITHVL